MKLRTKASTLLLSAFLLILGLSCSGGSGSPAEFAVSEIGDGDPTPVITNSELVVGPNRFSLGVLGPDGLPVVDAHVQLKFYDLNGGKPALKAQSQAVSRVPARDAGLPEAQQHMNADGTMHVQANAGEDVGVYTTNVTFDRAGAWGVEVDIHSSHPELAKTMRVRFDVLKSGSTPGIGSPAPRSENLTARDVADISEIDSSANPTIELHTSTIADAIDAGEPTLVLFAVPGYCQSRFCGDELAIMHKLWPAYRGRAEFIHVEFYKNPGSSEPVVSDAAREWNLRTEPWFFVIDAKGVITAKFEGATDMRELDEALRAVVKP